MNPGLSDHSPLVMHCYARVQEKGKPFKFFNYMADHGNFINIIEDFLGVVEDIQSILGTLKTMKLHIKQ